MLESAVLHQGQWNTARPAGHGDIFQGRQLGKLLTLQFFSFMDLLLKTLPRITGFYVDVWSRGAVSLVERNRGTLLSPEILKRILFCFVSGESLCSYYLSLPGRESSKSNWWKSFSLVFFNVSNFHSCWMRWFLTLVVTPDLYPHPKPIPCLLGEDTQSALGDLLVSVCLCSRGHGLSPTCLTPEECSVLLSCH